MRELQTCLVPVTRELAAEFANMLPAPGDRALKQNTLTMLRKAAINRLFHPYPWASCLCRQDGKTYRVNGKHGSTVLSEPEVPIEGIQVIVQRYEVETLAEVAELYAQFDRKESSRSKADLNRSFSGTDPELAPLPRHFVNRAVCAVSMALYGLEYWRFLRPHEQSRLATREHKAFLLYTHAIVGSNTKIFGKAPVLAVMFMTYQESPSLAAAFWAAVRSGEGTDPQGPDRKLRDYLLTHRIVSFSSGRRGNNVGQKEVMDRCTKAWSAWRSRQKAGAPASRPAAAGVVESLCTGS